MVLELGAQLEKEEVAGRLDDQFDRLELGHVIVFIIVSQVALDKLLVFVEEFVKQESTHHESMLRPDYFHNTATRHANFDLISNHFNRSWHKPVLEKLFQLGQCILVNI